MATTSAVVEDFDRHLAEIDAAFNCVFGRKNAQIDQLVRQLFEKDLQIQNLHKMHADSSNQAASSRVDALLLKHQLDDLSARSVHLENSSQEKVETLSRMLSEKDSELGRVNQQLSRLLHLFFKMAAAGHLEQNEMKEAEDMHLNDAEKLQWINEVLQDDTLATEFDLTAAFLHVKSVFQTLQDSELSNSDFSGDTLLSPDSHVKRKFGDSHLEEEDETPFGIEDITSLPKSDENDILYEKRRLNAPDIKEQKEKLICIKRHCIVRAVKLDNFEHFLMTEAPVLRGKLRVLRQRMQRRRTMRKLGQIHKHFIDVPPGDCPKCDCCLIKSVATSRAPVLYRRYTPGIKICGSCRRAMYCEIFLKHPVKST